MDGGSIASYAKTYGNPLVYHDMDLLRENEISNWENIWYDVFASLPRDFNQKKRAVNGKQLLTTDPPLQQMKVRPFKGERGK